MPATSRPAPTWRWAMPWRAASRSAYVVVPGPGFLNTTAALSTGLCGATRRCWRSTGQIQQAHDRPQCRTAARAARPARDHARPHQMGRPHHMRRPRRRAWSTRPSAACCRAVSRPVGLECAMDTWARKAPVELTSTPAQADPCPVDEDAVERAARLSGQRATSADRGRRRRAGRRRARQAIAEMLDAPVMTGRMGQGVFDGRHQALGHHAGRLPLLGRGRRRAGRRHAAAAAAAELGHGRCAEDHPHRHRQRGARPPAPSGDRHRRRRRGDA